MGGNSTIQWVNDEGNGTPVSNNEPLPVALSGGIGGLDVNQGDSNGDISEAWTVRPTDGTNSQEYTASGEAKVSADSLPLPTGAATEAKQDAEITALNSIDSKTPDMGQALMSASVPVAIASDQSPIEVSISSVPLPTGAATEATLEMIANATQVLEDPIPTRAILIAGTDGADTLPLLTDSGGALEVNVSTLPSGLATEAKQDIGNASLDSIDDKLGTLGQKAMAGSAPVVIASDQSAVPSSQSGTWTVQPGNTANTTPWVVSSRTNDGSGSQITSSLLSGGGGIRGLDTSQIGKSAVARNRIDYSGSPVTTSAYTQIVATLSAAVREVEIFDSSGQTLVLATGAPASEVDQVYIFPGGNGRIPLYIAGGTRVSIKAVSANATVGESAINFYS